MPLGYDREMFPSIEESLSAAENSFEIERGPFDLDLHIQHDTKRIVALLKNCDITPRMIGVDWGGMVVRFANENEHVLAKILLSQYLVR